VTYNAKNLQCGSSAGNLPNFINPQRRCGSN
jgi:4-alpha-methyl-delta7-sterol-4alpha-methyl oxidase